MCNFKIGKITYSKSQSITMYDDSKNKPSLYTEGKIKTQVPENSA